MFMKVVVYSMLERNCVFYFAVQARCDHSNESSVNSVFLFCYSAAQNATGSNLVNEAYNIAIRNVAAIECSFLARVLIA